MASMDIREKRRRIYSISGGFHIFLFWPELRLYITFFLPRNKKKMFTTRKVYSPYGISYTQKKKKTLKMFEKKKHKKKELGRSAKQSGGGGSRPLVCTVVVKISQSVKRKAYGCIGISPTFFSFLFYGSWTRLFL
jgi:hypothetical protein